MTAVNQSKVKMFRRCQKQFAYRYDYADEGKEMVPKRHKAPLYRGTWLHALVQAHTLNMAGVGDKDWEDVHADFTAQFEKLFLEEREELGDLPSECERIFRAYLRFWAADADRYRIATLPSGEPAVEFIVERSLAKWKINTPFKGRIDLLLEDLELGGLWIRDYKWVKNVPGPEERMMSPQNPMYVWAARGMGLDVRGFVYDYGRTKPPAIPQLLKKGTLSVKKNMDTTFDTYVAEIKRVHGEHWRRYAQTIYRDKLMQLKGRDVLWFRREPIPVEEHKIKQTLIEFILSARQINNREDPLKAPRSYFYNCKFGCEYHDLCCAEFAGLNIQPLIKKQFQMVSERYVEEESVDLLKD